MSNNNNQQEEINIEQNKSSSTSTTIDDNNQNNNHLGDKLNKHFSPLLFIGVFGGFILYIAFSVIFIKNAQNNETIKEALTNLNIQLTEQLIFEAEDILLYRTQSCFDLLRKIENNARYFAGLYKDKKANNVDAYINNFSVHLSKVDDDTESDEKKGIWGINKDNNDKGEITDEIKNELFIFTSLNPLLNAIYKSANYHEEYIENIFIINNKKELFYDFPLSNDTYFKKGNKRIFCYNEIKGTMEQLDQIIMPKEYDYHCQEWFADSIKLNKITNSNYYISSPYYIEKREKILIMTFCLNSTKLIKDDDKDDNRNYYLFCLNAKYQILLENMENINHKISGYFFVTRVYTQKAFYYPKRQMKNNGNETLTYYFDNFDIEEFQLNDNYYLDELNKYLNTTSVFIHSYDNNEVNSLLDIQDPKLKGEFVKDDKTYFYYVLPIFNHLSDLSINLMNIIYICPEEVINNKLVMLTDETINISTLTFPFFLFLIQTLIVQILVTYLIYAIAFNIVLPMKNIKKIFEKFNKDDQEVDDDTDNILLNKIKISMMNNNISNNLLPNVENNDNEKEKNENKKDINVPASYRSKSISFHFTKKLEMYKGKMNKVKTIKNKNNINNQIDFDNESSEKDAFLSNYKDSDSDSDNEEDYINIKSKDIQDLFCKMINVKNSLDIVNSDEQNDIKKLSDILFASEIFNEIKNESAKNICLSNIGNILLKLKKYDIAILHLIESDTYNEINDEHKGEYRDNDFNNLFFSRSGFKIKKKKKKNKKSSILKRSINDSDLSKEQIGQKIIEENKPLIENRYPKLIYCYKQFFKSLKKLKKIKSQEITNNKIDEYEMFISKEYHMLAKFKEYIEKYVKICQIEGNYIKSNTRYIQALLEKIEFMIKYEIVSNNINEYNDMNHNNDMAEKMKALHDLFIKVKNKIKNNKEIIKPKNILKSLLKEQTSNESDDIPNSLLIQRLNYYRGCLALKCCHYMEAVKKFQKIYIKSSNKITDGNIAVKGFKKLIKIAEIMKKKCALIKKKEEESILKAYINNKSKEIKKFSTVERDFIILISTNTPNIDFFTISLENTRYIIDNYVKNNDRYCISFVFSDKKCTGGLKIITKLESKNDDNNDITFEFIQNIKQDIELLLNYVEDEDDNIKYILQKAKSYVTNKNMNKERNTLFIFFGNKCRLSQESIDFLYSEELGNYISGENEKLLLILQDNYEQNESNRKDDSEMNSLKPVKEKDFDYSKINKKYCMYIHFDEIQKIKKEVTMFGQINSNDNYNIEKYEAKKIANE